MIIFVFVLLFLVQAFQILRKNVPIDYGEVNQDSLLCYRLRANH